MTRRLLLVSLASVAACATAYSGSGDDVDPDVDARIGTPIDGPIGTPIDAPIDAPTGTPIDAPVDAPACTPGMTQLLINPAFDLAPLGTGWSQTAIDPLYPVITADTPVGFSPHTAPNQAWMGGFEVGSDSMEQTVTIPAGTTQLTLTGVRFTGTDELGSTPYDTSTINLVSTSGGLLEQAAMFSNASANSNYAAFSKTFAQPRAGQTVKLRFDSVQDGSYGTSFFYDSLALTAVVGCP